MVKHSFPREYTEFLNETTVDLLHQNNSSLSSGNFRTATKKTNMILSSSSSLGDIKGMDKQNLKILTFSEDRNHDLENSLFSHDEEDSVRSDHECNNDDVYIESVLKDLCLKEMQTGHDDDLVVLEDNLDEDEEDKEEEEEEEEEDVAKRDIELHESTDATILLKEEHERIPSISNAKEERKDPASPRTTAVEVESDVVKRGRKGFLKRVTTLPPSNSNKSRGITLRKNRTALPKVSQQKHSVAQEDKYSLQNDILEPKQLHNVQEHHGSVLLQKDDDQIMLQEDVNVEETKEAAMADHKHDRYEVAQEQDGKDTSSETLNSTNAHLKELENLRDEPLIVRKARTTHANVTFMRRLNPRSGNPLDTVERGENLKMQMKNDVSNIREGKEQEQKNTVTMDRCIEDEERDENVDSERGQDNNKSDKEEDAEEESACNAKCDDNERSQNKKIYNIRSMESTDMSMASIKTQKISNRRNIFSSPFRNLKSDRRSGTPMKKLSSKSSNGGKKSGLKLKQGIK